MQLEVAPQVAELLSDEQLSHLHAQANSGEPARCVRCEQVIEPDPGETATLVLVSDPDSKSAAAQLSHVGCGPSEVVEGRVSSPGRARLAWRWATFTLPRVPVLVLETRGGAWTDDAEPALMRTLRAAGFEDARPAFDSSLFATGEGDVATAPGVLLARYGDDLLVIASGGHVLDELPGAATGPWFDLVREAGGALVAVSDAAALPEADEILNFDDLLPRLLDRGIAAWLVLADDA